MQVNRETHKMRGSMMMGPHNDARFTCTTISTSCGAPPTHAPTAIIYNTHR